jgi:hypothetical protein
MAQRVPAITFADPAIISSVVTGTSDGYGQAIVSN